MIREFKQFQLYNPRNYSPRRIYMALDNFSAPDTRTGELTHIRILYIDNFEVDRIIVSHNMFRCVLDYTLPEKRVEKIRKYAKLLLL